MCHAKTDGGAILAHGPWFASPGIHTKQWKLWLGWGKGQESRKISPSLPRHHHHVLIKTFLYYFPFHYRRVIAFMIWKVVEDVMWLIRSLDSFRAFKSFLELSSSSITSLFNLISSIILCISFFV